MSRSTSAPELYRNTQFGTLVVGALVASLLVFLVIGFLTGWPIPLFAAATIPLVLLGLFHSLTTVVTDREVTIAFGPGWVSKAIPLADIEGAKPERIGFFWGWGIRYWPGRGWMWNVSGFDVVVLELPGGRHFRIGTDDPDGLAGKIREARGALA